MLTTSRRIAVVIGCARFESVEIDDLKYTEKDAEAVQALLSRSQFTCSSHFQSPGWHEINDAIFEGLDQAKPDDTVLLYYSGHGFKDERGRLYLAGRDTNRNKLRVSAVSTADVREQLEECRSKRICVILDCCFSGAFGQKGGERVAAGEVNEALAGEGTCIMTSAQSTQTARERDDFEHGVFTHYLLEGMRGAADRDDNGFITPDELHAYVAAKMAEEVGDIQKPVKDARTAGASFNLVTNHDQREKLAEALRRRIEVQTARKRHAVAMELLEAEDADGIGKAERARLRATVEREMAQLAKQFRARLGAAVLAETLSADVLSEFDGLLKDNPRFLFVRTEEMPRQREKLLRSAMLDRIQIDALADLWPGPGASWPPQSARTPRGSKEPGLPPGAGGSGEPPVGKTSPVLQDGKPSSSPTGRRLLPAVWAGLAAAAAILAFWASSGSERQPFDDLQNLRVGLVMREGWDPETRDAAQGAFAHLLDQVNAEIEGEWPGGERIRFDTSELATFFGNDLYRGDGLMDQLERGEVYLVGELSPYNIHMAEQTAGAQPFVQPRWNGGETYRAVIVGVDPGVRTLDELVTELIQHDSRVATGDTTSTSGYWYPRHMLLTHQDIRDALIPFGQLAGQPKDILEAVCLKRSNYIAGVVPSYRFDDPGFEGPCELHEIHRSQPIPQGAFVLSRGLHTMLREEMRRLDDLQLAWRNAVAGSDAAALGGFFPERFEAVEFSAIYDDSDIFEVQEAGEERAQENVMMTIVIPALVLVGVGMFTVFRRWPRPAVGIKMDRVSDGT